VIELGRKVYGQLLSTYCCQPQVSKESHAELMSQPPRYDPNEILPVRILEVSKTTNAEANPIFNSGNCFTTAANSDMGWDHIYHMFF